MNALDELAGLIAGLRIGDVPAATVTKLKLHIADIVGAWVAAAHTSEGKALIAFRNRGQGLHPKAAAARAKAAAAESRRSLPDDLAAHCALVRLSEIDDIHLASMTTPGSIVIPAALTLAAQVDADHGDVAAAMLAGYEAMVRLGLAIKGPDILYRGIWPTYFAAGFGTTAVAARLLRLDRRQTAQALSLALTMAAPAVGQHHAVTTARWLLVGNAARNGLNAALAAQAGFTADLGVLQSRLFPDVYGIEPDLGIIGDAAAPALDRVSFKPWCAARQTMAATQALREILDSGIAAADISALTAYVLPPHLKMIDHGIKPGDRASFITSLPYQLAVAALHPDRMLEFEPLAENDLAEVQVFMGRVRVAADDTLLSDYPAAWPARLVVTTPSGQHERRVHDIPGDPARPFTEVDVGNKFQRLVTPLLGTGTLPLLRSSLMALRSREAMLSLVKDLETVMAGRTA